jgi:ABC-type Fe3+ transport system substrate-binding protein
MRSGFRVRRIKNLTQPIRHAEAALTPRRRMAFWILTGVVCAAGFHARGALQLVVLSPHNETIREEFELGFSRWHRERHGENVDIDWRIVGGSSESIRFVQSEFARKPEGIGIDVFYGGGHEPFYELAARGWCDPYRPPDAVLSGLAAEVAGIELRPADFAWHAAAISSFGILQNLRVRQLAGLPAVSRWGDLTQPRLFGWVGAGDPRGSGTMHVMFESFLQARGWETGWQLLTQMAGNTRRFDRVSSTTAKDAALGESAYALAVDFYAFSQIAAAGRSNLTFVLPLDFAAVSPDGIAILRGAAHRELAQRFLEFVLSDSGQQLWLLPRGYPGGPVRHSIERMPVRPELYARYAGVSNVEFSPFTLTSRFRYDARLAQRRRGVVAALAGAMLVDLHHDLKDAWSVVIRLGLKEADVRDLGRVPISEAEAFQLANESWDKPAVRNTKRTEWQIWARSKYRRLAAKGERPGP